MNILVINCGSSSIKFKLYDMANEQEAAGGLIERIGEETSKSTVRIGGEDFGDDAQVADHTAGISKILELLGQHAAGGPADPQNIGAVGHRVVHGGEEFSESVVVDDGVIDAIDKCSMLAPLHNPANLAGIKAAAKILPGKPQVAVFDTAYFQTMPPYAYRYAVPHEWYSEHRVRRYGFHGTSHRYVAEYAAKLLANPKPSLVTMHLGNGASMACIKKGEAVDATMGLTPLEGLMMGTRSGDLDPAIIFHMIREGMSVDDVRNALEKKSGLLGVSGVSNDMRDVEEAAKGGNERAELALQMFSYRVRKYLGAFLASMGTCDGLIFTGGIGENGAEMRGRILVGLGLLGVVVDSDRNNVRAKEPVKISADVSKIPVWVIPTNEELMIARDTLRLVDSAEKEEETA